MTPHQNDGTANRNLPPSSLFDASNQASDRTEPLLFDRGDTKPTAPEAESPFLTVASDSPRSAIDATAARSVAEPRLTLIMPDDADATEDHTIARRLALVDDADDEPVTEIPAPATKQTAMLTSFEEWVGAQADAFCDPVDACEAADAPDPTEAVIIRTLALPEHIVAEDVEPAAMDDSDDAPVLLQTAAAIAEPFAVEPPADSIATDAAVVSPWTPLPATDDIDESSTDLLAEMPALATTASALASTTGDAATATAEEPFIQPVFASETPPTAQTPQPTEPRLVLLKPPTGRTGWKPGNPLAGLGRKPLIQLAKRRILDGGHDRLVRFANTYMAHFKWRRMWGVAGATAACGMLVFWALRSVLT